MEYVYYVIAGYLILINMIGICIMGVDKRKARKHKWRIKEATLFLIAILGGSIGTLIGMYAFRHKTKHWYFVVGMPLILILQIVAVVLLYIKVFSC